MLPHESLPMVHAETTCKVELKSRSFPFPEPINTGTAGDVSLASAKYHFTDVYDGLVPLIRKYGAGSLVLVGVVWGIPVTLIP